MMKDFTEKYAPIKGGSPVAVVSDLTKEEFLAVYYFRCWYEGIEALQVVENEFFSRLGDELGFKTMSALEALCETLYKKGRRQLIRHDLNCKCVGADENCFAQLVTLSTLKEKEDAMLISVLLSDSSIAPTIVGLAEDFGMGINALLRSISEENSNNVYPIKSNYN